MSVLVTKVRARSKSVVRDFVVSWYDEGSQICEERSFHSY